MLEKFPTPKVATLPGQSERDTKQTCRKLPSRSTRRSVEKGKIICGGVTGNPAYG